MKKSVILAILVIYLAAILVVGIWGIKTYIFNPNIYVSEIKLVDSLDGEYKVETNAKNPDIDFIRIKYRAGLKFRIYYRVGPDDATDMSMEFDFIINEEYRDKIEISSDGVVTVKANEAIIIDGKIRAMDGGQAVSRKIRIFVMPT